MGIRVCPLQLIAMAVLWSVISALAGFLASRYVIDAEVRRTDATVQRAVDNLDRFRISEAQQVVNITQALDRKIDALANGKEQPK
jgi:hypothetical protein